MKIGMFNKEELLNSRGEFIGYNLGYDYSTEHEYGIPEIREAFGVAQTSKNAISRMTARLMGTKPEFGLKARTATKRPGNVTYSKGEFFSIGFSTSFVNMDSYIKDTEQKLAWPGRKEPFIARWDEGGFVISTKIEAHFEALKTAIDNNDVAFYLGGKGFLATGGLHVVIASRVDKEVDEMMRAMDEDNYDLGRAADATGIEAELLSAHKKFRVLTPGWVDEKKSGVNFWLNPFERTEHAGWYTVEELREWIKGGGPVVNGKPKEAETNGNEKHN